MKKSTILSIAIVGVALIGTIVFVSTSSKNDTPSTTSSSAVDAVATNSVSITNFKYEPAVITVKAGTTVTWTNKDTVKHTVTADNMGGSAAPMSSLFAKDETYTYTYKAAGTYDYHCEPHPYMRGSVVVTE